MRRTFKELGKKSLGAECPNERGASVCESLKPPTKHNGRNKDQTGKPTITKGQERNPGRGRYSTQSNKGSGNSSGLGEFWNIALAKKVALSKLVLIPFAFKRWSASPAKVGTDLGGVPNGVVVILVEPDREAEVEEPPKPNKDRTFGLRLMPAAPAF
jgi:hypothetical protein